jgi:hypothetical protein
MKEADVTFNDDNSIIIGDKNIDIEGGNRLVYKNDQIEVRGNGIVGINNQSISVNSENITIKGEPGNLTLIGSNFSVGNNTFTGIRGPGQATQTEDGYVVGTNTIAQTPNITLFAEGGPTELLNECKGKPNSQNYVMPCKTKLTMEGKGTSVAVNSGYGLNIQKGDNLRYYIEGGKVTLDNGQELIEVNEEVVRGKPGEIITVNGNSVKKYQTLNGETQILTMIKPPTYILDENYGSPQPEVDLATKIGDKFIIEDSELGTTKLYSCNDDKTAGMVTGAASFSGIIDSCKELVGFNTKKANAYVGTKWGDEVITNYGDFIMKADPQLTGGKELYFRVITTSTPKGGTEEYRVYNDGSIERYDKAQKMYVKTNEAMPPGSFGLTKEQIAQSIQTPEKKPSQPQTQKKENDAITAYQNYGEKVWNDQRKGQEQGVYYLPASAPPDSYIHLTPSKGSMIRNSEFLVEPVKDKSGKIIKYIGVTSGVEFVPIGDGKVRQVK